MKEVSRMEDATPSLRHDRILYYIANYSHGIACEQDKLHSANVKGDKGVAGKQPTLVQVNNTQLCNVIPQGIGCSQATSSPFPVQLPLFRLPGSNLG